MATQISRKTMGYLDETCKCSSCVRVHISFVYVLGLVGLRPIIHERAYAENLVGFLVLHNPYGYPFLYGPNKIIHTRAANELSHL